MLKTVVLGPQCFLAVCLKCRSSKRIELKCGAVVGPRPDCTDINLEEVVHSGGVILQKQSRCTAGDMTQPCWCAGEQDECWVENSHALWSQGGTLFLSGEWSSVLWEQERGVFFSNPFIWSKSPEKSLGNDFKIITAIQARQTWSGAELGLYEHAAVTVTE